MTTGCHRLLHSNLQPIGMELALELDADGNNPRSSCSRARAQAASRHKPTSVSTSRAPGRPYAAPARDCATNWSQLEGGALPSVAGGHTGQHELHLANSWLGRIPATSSANSPTSRKASWDQRAYLAGELAESCKFSGARRNSTRLLSAQSLDRAQGSRNGCGAGVVTSFPTWPIRWL